MTNKTGSRQEGIAQICAREFLQGNYERIAEAVARSAAAFVSSGGDIDAPIRAIITIVGESNSGDLDIAGTAAFTTLLTDFVRK